MKILVIQIVVYSLMLTFLWELMNLNHEALWLGMLMVYLVTMTIQSIVVILGAVFCEVEPRVSRWIRGLK